MDPKRDTYMDESIFTRPFLHIYQNNIRLPSIPQNNPPPMDTTLLFFIMICIIVIIITHLSTIDTIHLKSYMIRYYLCPATLTSLSTCTYRNQDTGSASEEATPPEVYIQQIALYYYNFEWIITHPIHVLISYGIQLNFYHLCSHITTSSRQRNDIFWFWYTSKRRRQPELIFHIKNLNHFITPLQPCKVTDWS